MAALQVALINFVNDGNPNGIGQDSAEISGYHWPLYSESHEITVLNASKIAKALSPPHRPGFDVVHKFLRLGGY